MNEFSGNHMSVINSGLREAKPFGNIVSLLNSLFLALSLLFILQTEVFPQTYGQTYSVPNAGQTNYTDQSMTKQEIARLEIKVVRGDQMLPISLVPRVKKGDILKVHLLDEPISGVKIDQTSWDWTLVVAYANPLINKQKEETVSQEINFRRQGWYKEYSFVVPFDSQPVFFLSPRAHYRDQIFKAMSRNFGDLHKIGEKMVEISGAYAQINTFLNELQTVVNRNQSGYNQYGNGSYGNQYGYNPNGGTYGNGTYPYSTPQYGTYNGQYGNYNQTGSYYQNPYWLDQAVERLAKSFNVAMPGCWYANGAYTNGGAYNGGYGNTYNNGNSGYAYGNGYGNSYGSGSGAVYGDQGFNGQDFVARSQCVAKSVSLKDFDISVTRMWQQGGTFFAAELVKKYPQLAFYINIAAAAIDFIVKVFQKSPLRIVPTMLVSADNAAVSNQSNAAYNTGAGYGTMTYQNNFVGTNPPSPGATSTTPLTTKFSVFSSTLPSDQGYLTAYPVVVQKWQAEPDPEVIRLSTPSLSESCLHTGINLLKNTNLTDDWMGDNFTRDVKIIMTSDNGFKKELPLRKNLGLGGWELNLPPQDAAQIPKVAMSLEGQIVGMRGFSQVTSDKFKLPVATDSKWEVISETQKDFSVGGKRRIALRNTTGDCLCIQSVTYKPSFGGQFTFERGSDKNSLQTSIDGRSVAFEVDTLNFNPGQGTLEIRTFGGDASNLNLKLYPAPPAIRDVRVARGDRQVLISGERMEQLRYVTVNGYRATVQPNVLPLDDHNPQIVTKLAVFDDPRVRQTGTAVTLELGLEDDRHVSYPQAFEILPARPAIIADENNEINGISDAELTMRENVPVKVARPDNSKKQSGDAATGGNSSIAAQLIAGQAAVFPITTKTVSINIQNPLTDYDFKNESLAIETRIEKSQTPANDFIKPNLEVLDWKTMRIKFTLLGDTYTQLGGRRIQFRIRDKERGDSDWYTIRQTFTRVPEVASVKCVPEMNGMCEMKGDGMDYIGQVSVDGGKTWFQGESGNLRAQPTADGQSEVMIPQLVNKKLLRLKLRDFPLTAGLFAGNFAFVNLIKPNFTQNFGSLNKGAGAASENKLSGAPPATTPSAATGAPAALPANPPAGAVVPAPGQQVNNAGNTDLNNQLPRLPSTGPGQNAQQNINRGSLMMIDEIVEPAKPTKP